MPERQPLLVFKDMKYPDLSDEPKEMSTKHRSVAMKPRRNDATASY